MCTTFPNDRPQRSGHKIQQLGSNTRTTMKSQELCVPTTPTLTFSYGDERRVVELDPASSKHDSETLRLRLELEGSCSSIISVDIRTKITPSPLYLEHSPLLSYSRGLRRLKRVSPSKRHSFPVMRSNATTRPKDELGLSGTSLHTASSKLASASRALKSRQLTRSRSL